MSKPVRGRIDTVALRGTLGHFPTGVAVVTARNGTEAPAGMTINSFCSLSLSPPLVAWSVSRRAGSYDSFQRCGEYTISILGDEQVDIAKRFATPGEDRFRDIDCRGEGGPVIPGACAWLRCAVYRRIIVGDHLMLIGEVREFACAGGQPLAFAKGAFSGIEALVERPSGLDKVA